MQGREWIKWKKMMPKNNVWVENKGKKYILKRAIKKLRDNFMQKTARDPYRHSDIY